MARVNNLSNFLTDVASAIKTKKGSETAIPAANFDTEILALPSQGVYQTKVITISENGQTIITPDTGYDAMDGVQVTTNIPEKQLQTKSYSFTTNQTIELLPDTGYDGFSEVGLNINIQSQLQAKSLDVTTNGTYQISPDQNYDGLTSVIVNVDVQEQEDNQHIPFYLLESDDNGNLWCVNNYSTLLYVPYALDENGNLIVIQDEDDSAVYSINENMELEVVVNG